MKLSLLDWNIYQHSLKFKFLANTSKTSLHEHDVIIIEAKGNADNEKNYFSKKTHWKWPKEIAKAKNLTMAIPYNKSMIGAHGEWSPLSHLSRDFCLPSSDGLRKLLTETIEELKNYNLPSTADECLKLVQKVCLPEKTPSLCFALETLLLDLYYGAKKMIFDSQFYRGTPININGLVWIGNLNDMSNKISQLLEQKYSCIKIKIGINPIEEEIRLIEEIRKYANSKQIQIRLDANGAYDYDTAKEVIKTLRNLEIHSIEQPIPVGQLDNMKKLVNNASIPIALDEELVLNFALIDKLNLVKYIKPQYLVLKPQLLGGFLITKKIISLAESLGIQWWITSALESNIGLNAIAQFQGLMANQTQSYLAQGLGTGQLYHNNLKSPLQVVKDMLVYKQKIR